MKTFCTMRLADNDRGWEDMPKSGDWVNFQDHADIVAKKNKLINDHWKWTAGLLETMRPINYGLDTVEYVYKTAFEHGYKHGREDSK